MYVPPELARELEHKWIELLWDGTECNGLVETLKQ